MSSSSSNTNRGQWTPSQDEALRIAVAKNGAKNWKRIASEIPSEGNDKKSHVQALQRWNKVCKPGLVKGPWTSTEDELLCQATEFIAANNWVGVAEKIVGRTAKQCRERWLLCLNPAIRKDKWEPEEDALLLKLHEEHGNSWARFAKLLPGRTENACKSRFKSLSRRKEKCLVSVHPVSKIQTPSPPPPIPSPTLPLVQPKELESSKRLKIETPLTFAPLTFSQFEPSWKPVFVPPSTTHQRGLWDGEYDEEKISFNSIPNSFVPFTQFAQSENDCEL